MGMGLRRVRSDVSTVRKEGVIQNGTEKAKMLEEASLLWAVVEIVGLANIYNYFVPNEEEETDNPKELEIIKYQKANGLGVFACDEWKVFSDKKVDIGGVSTAPVLISPDFTKYFRKDKPDRYLNTPLFMDMWKQIKDDNKYSL